MWTVAMEAASKMWLTGYFDTHYLVQAVSVKAGREVRKQPFERTLQEHRMRAIARRDTKLDFRVNNTKGEAGSKLQDAKLEKVNGAPVSLRAESASLSVPVDKESLTTAVKAIAAAARAVGWQKAEKKRVLTSTDDLRRGMLVDNDCLYRQTFAIRSYEVGFDQTASIETITNLFQETALNHVRKSPVVGDGMGTTHAMIRNRLIWVVTRMHVEVGRYPIWGDVVQIDSWVGASGKNGMRRDFLVRDYSTGQMLARATSNWAMMNQDTRKLSKMPDEVRAEISSYFVERYVMEDKPIPRITKIDESASYLCDGLVPKLHDMDMNKHVNHVKYIGWVLESIPQALLVAYELTSMILEYRKECSGLDVVSSLTQPELPFSTCNGSSVHRNNNNPDLVSTVASSFAPSISNPCIPTKEALRYTHLLKLQRDGTEILRAKTKWRLKKSYL